MRHDRQAACLPRPERRRPRSRHHVLRDDLHEIHARQAPHGQVDLGPPADADPKLPHPPQPPPPQPPPPQPPPQPPPAPPDELGIPASSAARVASSCTPPRPSSAMPSNTASPASMAPAAPAAPAAPGATRLRPPSRVSRSRLRYAAP